VRTRRPFYRPNETNADTTACFEILRDGDFVVVPETLAWLRRDRGTIGDNLKRFGSEYFLNFSLVVRYGRENLEQAEYARRVKDLENEYLAFLGRSLVSRRGEAFWRFHEAAFRSLGVEFPRAQIRLELARYLLRKFRSPLKTAEHLCDRARALVQRS
jgi:hypothetical protein